jgi:hypothetical protein
MWLWLLGAVAFAQRPAPDTQEDTGPVEAAPLQVDEGSLPTVLVDIARSVRGLSIGARMKAISEPLVGLPYVIDATGEGRAPDLDPPARYDAFDCLTFVEEVLALAIPGDPLAAPLVRHQLRYGDAAATYSNRSHFMLEEWIPRNIANGLLVDITAELGEAHLLVKEINDKTWSWWGKRKYFELPDSRLPTGTFQLQLMSLGAAFEVLEDIPDGALILTVRESREYVPIVVTHIGFKIPGTDVPRMRHATKMGEDPRVRDDRLAWYLEHVRWYHRWPVVGITVLMPQELGPRGSLLVGGPTNALR